MKCEYQHDKYVQEKLDKFMNSVAREGGLKTVILSLDSTEAQWLSEPVSQGRRRSS